MLIRDIVHCIKAVYFSLLHATSSVETDRLVDGWHMIYSVRDDLPKTAHSVGSVRRTNLKLIFPDEIIDSS